MKVGSFDTYQKKKGCIRGEYDFEVVDICKHGPCSFLLPVLCSNVSFPFKLLELSEICGITKFSGVIDESVRPGFTSTQVAVKELNRDGIQGDKEWLVSLSIEIFALVWIDMIYQQFLNTC
jgi:hypothetical protein